MLDSVHTRQNQIFAVDISENLFQMNMRSIMRQNFLLKLALWCPRNKYLLDLTMVITYDELTSVRS